MNLASLARVAPATDLIFVGWVSVESEFIRPPLLSGIIGASTSTCPYFFTDYLELYWVTNSRAEKVGWLTTLGTTAISSLLEPDTSLADSAAVRVKM
jgi:hypothetical protein